MAGREVLVSRSDEGHGFASPEAIVARLERLPLGAWHIRARVIIGVATFFDGFDVLAMTFVLPVLAVLWKIAPGEIGLILSSGFAGQLVGTLAAGWTAERIGRLRTATFTIAIFSVMSLCCALAWSSESMMVFRFIQGIGLGGEVPVAAAYISEIAHAKNRGRFFTLYELMFALGLLCTAVLAFLIIPWLGWRSMFYVGAAPAVLVLFLRRLLPESPRWLISKGRLEDADRVVSAIEQKIIASGRPLPAPAGIESVVLPHSELTSSSEIFEGIYLKRTLVAWVLWFSCYTVTYGLITWLPTLYRTVFHLSLAKALGYGLITQSVGFLGSTACAFLIDRVGRRRWFIIAFTGGGLSLVTLWMLGASRASAVLACSSASFFFISTISLTLYLYTSELYPTRIRAFGCSVASAWLRLASAVGPGIVGFLLARKGLPSVFLLFGSVATLGGIVTSIGATETKGRLLEEISP
jgi:putative MFS transporter